MNSKIVAVILINEGGKFRPYSLPVYGAFKQNRGIVDIMENFNTRQILTFFQFKICSGELNINWDGINVDYIENIEQLFEIIESKKVLEESVISLNQNEITSALIEKSVWDSICKPQAKANENFALLDLEVMSEFNVVDNYLTNANICWSPL